MDLVSDEGKKLSTVRIYYPTAPGLVFLADYFGVSLDYLMGRKDTQE